MDEKKLDRFIFIFTTAPAGLGHLRVTDALYQGLPKALTSYLIGSRDQKLALLHRVISIHPFTRYLMEQVQKGILEDWFTKIYRFYLRIPTSTFYEQITAVYWQNKKMRRIDSVVVIATHFGLAYQLAAIKKKLQKELGTKIYLVVQVTDDTSQHIWYVQGADIIFLSSDYIRNELIKYGQKVHLPKVRFEINPYPISPLLSNKLKFEDYQNRLSQVDFRSNSFIHISIPIPGAAVGLNYFDILVSSLRQKSNRFIFHIIGKQAPFTATFINKCRRFLNVDLHVSLNDWEVVQQYNHQYQRRVISLEVTKPSEQAFKALANPTQRGGVILLFSRPVGRQEYENLYFLRRHHLIPTQKQQNEILAAFNSDQKYSDSTLWRGIILPDNPKIAAEFIFWAIKSGLFSQMMAFRHKEPLGNELGSNGVSIFWKKLSNFFYLRHF